MKDGVILGEERTLIMEELKGSVLAAGHAGHPSNLADKEVFMVARHGTACKEVCGDLSETSGYTGNTHSANYDRETNTKTMMYHLYMTVERAS